MDGCWVFRGDFNGLQMWATGYQDLFVSGTSEGGTLYWLVTAGSYWASHGVPPGWYLAGEYDWIPGTPGGPPHAPAAPVRDGGGTSAAQAPQTQSPAAVCTTRILSAVNNQFGTNFTSADVEGEFQYSTDAPPGQGTFNLDISVPPQDQPDGVSPGRYPLSTWTYISGVGPTLHVPAGPGGLESPQTLPFSSSQFTAHIDSGFPYNPIGGLFHLFHDVLGIGGNSPCP